MAGTSLIALIDDIASLLDDIALLTKVATKKTVGVLGDDLALNAQQVSGVAAERELPVVWAVAKGSARNKAILVPVALALSAFAPWAVSPLLMFGGAFLCFEGFEKIAHSFFHPPEKVRADHAELVAALVATSQRSRGEEPRASSERSRAEEPRASSERSRAEEPRASSERSRAEEPRASSERSRAEEPRASTAEPTIDLGPLEKEKIKGAIRTDFVLSAEIVAITLGTVTDAPFVKQLLVLVGLSALMTVGVYGLVGGIVKLDDLGRYLHSRGERVSQAAGTAILRSAPYLMKALSIAGTIAMFLVGGGILVHGLPFAHHAVERLVEHAHDVRGIGAALAASLPTLLDGVAGVLAGAVALALVTLLSRLRGSSASTPA